LHEKENSKMGKRKGRFFFEPASKTLTTKTFI
jgi:hypothetical protein